MNKKGFTLIEMITVLIIISLIAIVSVTAVTKILESSKKAISKNQIEQIKAATRMWGSDNLLILPNDASSNNICNYSSINSCTEYYRELVITLKDLQDGGYISDNLKDAETDDPIRNTLKIRIIKNGNNLEYLVEGEE